MKKRVVKTTDRYDGEKVLMARRKTLPRDFVGRSKYAKSYRGELRRPDGSYYNRSIRRKYYSSIEKDHPAKTPLHIARWAIQEFTSPGDWVLDPTIGAGTTAVEALRMDRSVVGMEVEFIEIIKANIAMNNPHNRPFKIIHGDARNIRRHINRRKFDLIVNNPPYSGDVRQSAFGEKLPAKGKWNTHEVGYKSSLPNLGLLRENKEFWDAIEKIYADSIKQLKVGGRFVLGVKDMMRNKKPFLLHEMFGDIISKYLKYEFMTILRHYPPTLHLNTYSKRTGGITPPLYQVILVFRKDK